MTQRPALSAFYRSLSDPRVTDGLLFARATLAYTEAQRYADRRTQRVILGILEDLDFAPEPGDDDPPSST